MNTLRLLFSIGLLCAPTLVTADLTHSIGLDITDYDDEVVGENRTFELDTLQYGLSYGVWLESGIGVTLSGWQSQADEDWNTNAPLEREQNGLQLGASLPVSLWFSQLDADANYRLALTYAQSEANTRLNFANGNPLYREDVESWSLSTSLSRDWGWQSLTVSPSLGLSYQDFSSSLWQRQLFAVNQQIDQQDQGWSAEAGVNLAYDVEQSAQLLWSPYLTLNWFEPLTLDSAANQTLTLNRGARSRSQSSRVTSTTDEDSNGVYALGLFAVWQDWSADLSWSDTFATQTDTSAQLRFGVSRSF